MSGPKPSRCPRGCPRRPTDPEVQREIFRSQRWIARYRVKRALVLNPYTPSDIAARLLAFLARPDLRLVAESPTLPPQLREAAEHLAGKG